MKKCYNIISKIQPMFNKYIAQYLAFSSENNCVIKDSFAISSPDKYPAIDMVNAGFLALTKYINDAICSYDSDIHETFKQYFLVAVVPDNIEIKDANININYYILEADDYDQLEKSEEYQKIRIANSVDNIFCHRKLPVQCYTRYIKSAGLLNTPINISCTRTVDDIDKITMHRMPAYVKFNTSNEKCMEFIESLFDDFFEYFVYISINSGEEGE